MKRELKEQRSSEGFIVVTWPTAAGALELL